MPRVKKANMYNEPFPTRLRELIEETNVSQAELAEILGMSRQALNAYALGETSPDIKRLVAIAEYFDVTYDYLLGASESRKRENLNISERIGLNDAAISVLQDHMKDNNDLNVKAYQNAINTVLSSDDLVNHLVSFFMIKGDEGGYLLSSVKDPEYNFYHLQASPDAYAAAMLSRVQLILERLRTKEKYEHENFPPSYKKMINDTLADLEDKGGIVDGEHPQE